MIFLYVRDYNAYMKLILTSLIVFLLFCSCLSYSSGSRGSLSDAMDKSRDDWEGSRTVPEDDDDDFIWIFQDDEDDQYQNSKKRQDEEQYSSSDTSEVTDLGPLITTIRGGNAFVSEPDFDSNFDLDILLGSPAGRYDFYLYGNIKMAETKPDSSISESIDKNVLFLTAGIESRVYLFEEYPYMNPFVMGQLGLGYMFWSFKNPLDAGDEIISGDGLAYIHMSLGAGVEFLRTDHYRVGIMCIPETRIYGVATNQGFDNDVFDVYGTVRWSLECGYSF